MSSLPKGLVIICCLLIVGEGTLLDGQLGRASVTGIVSDPTGAVAPGVAVTATSVETGVAYKTTTNEVGHYTIGALPVGQYSVSFTSTGFKEFSRHGLSLRSAQVARIDVTLQVGEVTEKLLVTAETPLLETETAQASETVTANVFRDLPLSFGGGRNMAAFADKLVPGVRGDYWAMKIQGTPSGGQSVIIDGQNNLAGFLSGDFAEASISPEAIQELTVFTGNVAAEFGRAAGGALNFILRSGSNDLHGSGFFYLRNEILNANDWNNNRLLAADPNFTNPQTRNFLRPKERRFDRGFSVGGPVAIPKLYDGRNKTFFHITLERFKREEAGPTSLIRSVPQPEMFDGDLSRLLTGRQVGTDALGRPVMEGQLYDPKTLREAGGQFVADPFLGNRIPLSRISQLGRKFKSIFAEYYPPVTTDLTNNLYWTRYYKQNVKQTTIKVDHSFSPAHKVAGFYYRHGFPREFEDQGGIWSLKDPTLGGPLAKAMFQHRRGYNWNVNYDWLVGPALLNHASVGVNVNRNRYGSRHAGKGYASQWGLKGVGLGLTEDKWTQPQFNLGSSPVVSYDSWGMPDNRDRYYAGYIVNETLSWQRQKHNIKFGFEWNRQVNEEYKFDNSAGSFSFSARTTGIPGQSYTARTGHSFASFLLGEVDSASLTPVFNALLNRTYAAAFVQDTWKVSRRVTLNLGLRWSGNSPIYDKYDRIANFNVRLPDPNGNNLPGAVEYMGSGPGRAGKRSPAPGDWKDFGPTFGLAWQMTRGVVLRAGYGITFTPETIGWYHYFAAGLRPVNSVELDSKGLYRPAFSIDDGYPGRNSPVNLDPSWGQRYSSTRTSLDYAKAGYVQHFNFGLQAEVTRNLMVEVEWRASKGARLHSGGNVRPNQIRAEELSRGAVLGQVIDTPAKAAAAGLPYPYPGWTGLGAHTLQPFPQLTSRGLSAFGDPVGFSIYHSGNLIITRRMSKGIHLYGAYTFAKAIANVDDVTSSGNTTGLQDAYNRRVYKSVTPDDRTHMLKSSLTWELPLGKNKSLLGNANRVVNGMVGGWTVAAILGYSSGTPLGVPSSRTRPVGWNGPAVYANFKAPAGGFQRMFDPSRFNPWNANDPGNRFFDPSAFSDALTQQLGNSPVRFPQMRGLWSWNEDMCILKRFPIRERVTLQFRMELLNAFNRHYFGGPDTNMNNSYFGNVRTASGARSGQFGMRVDW
ncbi:MAG: carboxypeptidase regulatory-like domain-containing protein [Acidobacteriota bacterium]